MLGCGITLTSAAFQTLAIKHSDVAAAIADHTAELQFVRSGGDAFAGGGVPGGLAVGLHEVGVATRGVVPSLPTAQTSVDTPSFVRYSKDTMAVVGKYT